MHNYKKLEIYQEAKEIALDLYKITGSFPFEEKFGITQQIRRAATSIGANIAEGAGRNGNKDFARFLYNSFGSVNELDYFMDIANELSYLKTEQFIRMQERLSRLGKKIYQLISHLKNNNKSDF